MAYRPLNRARLLEIAPSDRLAFLEAAKREIDADIVRLQTGKMRIWSGRSRRYHLQLLFSRRQKLAALAQEAGYGDWTLEPTETM
ncbi:hypothetical protein Rumeso_03784 [Rubellimicrobium mesophilum DSM 19309]|uniref:Uncharacterized protein n=1 Tax=Rubellimicrobium mesophilum DSM 19309 TaxID=442562 RepID=A0A017HK09_9RHOB|nr:hypothetical protein [Rubellimicrobium mesophilum]EYD74488.1 hypothetical protein Rumeso_03784 [Rubellimicrobium mesophilum DSM 19309]